MIKERQRIKSGEPRVIQLKRKQLVNWQWYWVKKSPAIHVEDLSSYRAYAARFYISKLTVFEAGIHNTHGFYDDTPCCVVFDWLLEKKGLTEKEAMYQLSIKHWGPYFYICEFCLSKPARYEDYQREFNSRMPRRYFYCSECFKASQESK